MSILKSRYIHSVAACVLSLLSATAIAAGGAHTAAAPSTPRMSAPAQQPAAPATTRPTSAKTTASAHTTGQPNQTCGSASAPNTPGNAATAPGSAFNPDGKSGTVYAGEQPQNSRNPKSVSQYDVACAHQH